MAPTKATKLDFTDREDEIEDEVDDDDFAADDDFADDDIMFGRRWTWRIMKMKAASNVSARPSGFAA
jgi:hypothetical protein